MTSTADGSIPSLRRGQIIDSAIELIAEVGHARTSLSRIAEKAGVSKAAVLYHFTNKDELLDEVLNRVIGGLVEQVESAVHAAGTPAEAVSAYIRAMIGHLTAHPAHVRAITEALAIAELAGHQTIRADASRWKVLAELLAAGQAAGQLRDFDVKTTAVVIGGAIDGLVGQWLAEPDFDLRVAADELETLVQRAITI
ncbi:TetR family transcriptional regulator [Nocardia sp. NBC_00508]|uniref:TetR/AcrR family transcriptional regulator n=1 Tax=Nocardia sp. NBC_00508 TaxID=2975992 RepID=UPI002E8097CE|nr:TetR family transcriptional regulator [Nocardia sp. NBC_00508]WUD69457.1 TetR family transcriptional regulator [Nocardia sp. NBC_00508]